MDAEGREARWPGEIPVLKRQIDNCLCRDWTGCDCGGCEILRKRLLELGVDYGK